MKVNRKFIAEKAGVSTTTVSYVINNTPGTRISDEVRKRVMNIVRKYNYVPNASGRALVTGKTGNIGFIYKSSMMDFFSDPFTHEVFSGWVHELEKNDYSLMFALLAKQKGGNLSESARRMLSGKFVDGIVLYGNVDIEIVKRLKQAMIPFVLVDYLIEGVECNAILPDNRGGAKQAVKYLQKEGCSKICCLNGDLEDFLHPAYIERPGGYSDAMREAGMPLDIVSIQPDIEGAYATVLKLLKEGKQPDAFFATGDHIAIGCLKAIADYDSNLFNKIRIIGFDNIKWSEKDLPLLSTVKVPKIKLGEETIKMLLAGIKSESTGFETVRLKTELLIKGT